MSIDQNIKFEHIPDLVHRQLLPHLAVAHVLMKRADDSDRMNVWDVVPHMAESLYVLAQGFTVLLGG